MVIGTSDLYAIYFSGINVISSLGISVRIFDVFSELEFWAQLLKNKIKDNSRSVSFRNFIVVRSSLTVVQFRSDYIKRNFVKKNFSKVRKSSCISFIINLL
tara:strand:- start:10361 stop:10663 length:303 start_codon:yes stop_codon:yes gene_type:complete